MPIAAVYHRQFPDKAEGVKYMAAFMKSPAKDKSKVDPEAVNRFGLMPPMVLGDAELDAVAGWVWDQYNLNSGKGMGTGQKNENCQ